MQEDSYREIFSSKLKYLMKKNRITQQKLADRISVKHQSIGNYCTGNAIPSVENALAISEVFGCSIDFLFKDINDTNYHEYSPGFPLLSDEVVSALNSVPKKYMDLIETAIVENCKAINAVVKGENNGEQSES